MAMRLKICIWVFALLGPQVVFAKCLQSIYHISGIVSDAQNLPVAGAVVSLAWQERGKIQGPIITTSDAAGYYELEFGFNTYSRSGFIVADICKGNLTEVVASAFGKGIEVVGQTIAVNDRQIIANLSAKPADCNPP